jgi:thioredoxin-related protein
VKKAFLLAAAVALLSAGCKRSIDAAPPSKAQSGWLTDYKQAQQEAKKSKKLLFLDFTGSDWCGPCIIFKRNVLSNPEFTEYASKNLILMEVDFPQRTPLSPTLRKQNEELGMQYQVEAFPTVIVLTGEGRKVWEFIGYFPNGPRAFIAQLEKLRKG